MTKQFTESGYPGAYPDTQDFLSRFAASHSPEELVELLSDQRAPGIAGGQIDAGGLGSWNWGEGGVPLIDADLEHAGRALGRFRVFGDETRPMGMLVSQIAPIIIPMTARIMACLEAERRARVDGLTGVLNRSGLLTRLGEELQRARRAQTAISLLMADVDNMKQLNDESGHQAGDRALCRIADTLRGSLRGSDVVGRLGGDEFLAILPDADLEQARTAANRIRHELRGTRERLSLSIGLAAGTGDTPPEQLIRQADEAMYRIKQSERGRVSAA